MSDIAPMSCNKMLELLEQDVIQLEEALDTEPATWLAGRDTDGRSLLHWASLKGRQAHVQLLLARFRASQTADEFVARVNEADQQGTTPLICATLRCDAQIAEWLLDAGADVNACNAQGHSSLQYACSKGSAECFRLLMARGANMRAADACGDTPLFRCVALQRTQMIDELLQAGQKLPGGKTVLLDAQNREGNTPLHVACEDDDQAMAVLLIRHGADATLRNRRELTALEVAPPPLRTRLTALLNEQ